MFIMFSTCNRVFEGLMVCPFKVSFLSLTLECYMGSMGNGDSSQVLWHPQPQCWGRLRAVGTGQLVHALHLSHTHVHIMLLEFELSSDVMY